MLATFFNVAGWIILLFLLLFIWVSLDSIGSHLFALRKIAEERQRLNKS
jgi:hypothetical protein